jgi:hypothetical protein
VIRRGRRAMARALLAVCVLGVVGCIVGMAVAGAVHGTGDLA